jgi:hypothetical protein
VRRQLPEPLDVDVFGVDGIGFTELAFPDHGVLVAITTADRRSNGSATSRSTRPAWPRDGRSCA